MSEQLELSLDLQWVFKPDTGLKPTTFKSAWSHEVRKTTWKKLAMHVLDLHVTLVGSAGFRENLKLVRGQEIWFFFLLAGSEYLDKWESLMNAFLWKVDLGVILVHFCGVVWNLHVWEWHHGMDFHLQGSPTHLSIPSLAQGNGVEQPVWLRRGLSWVSWLYSQARWRST